MATDYRIPVSIHCRPGRDPGRLIHHGGIEPMIDVIRWKHELQQKKAELRDVMTYLRTNPDLTIDREQQMNDHID